MLLALLFSPRSILMFSAVIPAVWLLAYVRKMDRLEPESPALILSLLAKGIISTFIALVLEWIGTAVLDTFVAQGTLLYHALMYFVVVAMSEEGAKLLLLKKTTWNNREFNSRYDAIVYAVAVSMGFALWENISYVFRYGLSTALVRAFTAVPGHAAFAVSMGFWYGLSKKADRKGHGILSSLSMFFAFLLPVMIHGAYDFLATISQGEGILVFAFFIIILFLAAKRTVRKTSERDRYI